ncbi:MAG: hypothetical protein M1422_02945 [Candidatus Thermoplasmatota archaeon]|jgi:hypothetical protein|nr:hypothetical protein [Candidatus Sysuiplasma jiujiangense]MCL4317213.1 hypothetical protein [Candidatus Thermoplasmatota archaeon]MCL5253828.1 hypothetical protein [Candidatus Thermoplasmatota archaeon]
MRSFTLDNDANTAKTLTLIAIMLQVVFLVLVIFAIAAFVPLTPSGTTTTISNGTTVTTVTISPPIFDAGIVGSFFGVIFLIGLLWILLDYFLIYKKLAEEKVGDAETPALVLGIIQLLFGGIITGILLIVAYVKIKDSMRNRGNVAVAAPQSPMH